MWLKSSLVSRVNYHELTADQNYNVSISNCLCNQARKKQRYTYDDICVQRKTKLQERERELGSRAMPSACFEGDDDFVFLLK
jgi:hypothetical protein